MDLILEVGAGSIGITRFLVKSRIFYIALDTDKELLKKIKKPANPVVADMSKLPFRDNSFDFLIGLACIDYASESKRPKILEEFKRVTKKRIILESNIHDPEKGFIRQIYEKV